MFNNFLRCRNCTSPVSAASAWQTSLESERKRNWRATLQAELQNSSERKKNIFLKKCRMLMRDASEARKRLRTHAWRGDPSIAYGAGLIAIRSASWDLWRRRATTRASPDHEFIFRQLRARPVTEGAGVCRRKITTGSVFPGFSLSPVDFIFLEWFFIDRIWVIDR